jgi:RNA polymerase sigma factor (sigma-70 family)
MLTDQQLLRDYAEGASEAAFAEVVRRHLDLVYSAALRMVRDAQLAEDVTQGVFMAVARNARPLSVRPVLSSWLHRTTQNLAANVVRSEVRRRAREQEAAAMNEVVAHESDAVWQHIAPHLDTALGELSEADRDALMLRYFERKSAQEMAEVLGVSDEAAQKRVSRAVERLRAFFAKRGVIVGASALVVVLSANAVQAAPVGLAVTISTTAIAGTTGVATATAATIKTVAMTTLQKVLISATLIAVGVATPVVIQHQAKLRNETARTLSAGNGQATTLPAGAANEHDFPRESWAFKGYATPESALISLAWAGVSCDVEGFLKSLSPEQQSRVRLRWQRQGLSDEIQFRNSISNQFGPIRMIRVLNKEILSDNEVILRLQMEGERGGAGTVGKKVQRIGNEWKIGATL